MESQGHIVIGPSLKSVSGFCISLAIGCSIVGFAVAYYTTPPESIQRSSGAEVNLVYFIPYVLFAFFAFIILLYGALRFGSLHVYRDRVTGRSMAGFRRTITTESIDSVRLYRASGIPIVTIKSTSGCSIDAPILGIDFDEIGPELSRTMGSDLPIAIWFRGRAA